MEGENASRLRKIGLALVLLGVAVGTVSIMTLTEASASDLIPRSLKLADEEKNLTHSDEATTDTEDYDDDDEDYHRRYHHHHPGKLVIRLLILFFAVYGLFTCMKKSCKKLRKSRRQRRGFGHERVHYFPHQEMHYYVPPHHPQPQRSYPQPSPYGQPVNH